MEQDGSNPIRINCVILNFNDGETVARLVHMIHDYDYLEKIVLVDNHSTDDSWEQLQVLKDEKVELIRTEKNGGYGYGNNTGIRYAIEHNGATHVLVANPDVVFSESCVIHMARVYGNHPDAGVVTASIQDENLGKGRGRNGWKLHGFVGELLSMEPVCRRVFNHFLNYPRSYFKDKKAVYVDAVHGSMLMISAQAFEETGGYDEGIFLYQEEAVLGQRMRASGYRTVLLLNRTYQHQHSVSISKTYTQLLKRQKLRNESAYYYMVYYLHINSIQKLIAKGWFWMILLEDWLAAKVTGQ